MSPHSLFTSHRFSLLLRATDTIELYNIYNRTVTYRGLSIVWRDPGAGTSETITDLVKELKSGISGRPRSRFGMLRCAMQRSSALRRAGVRAVGAPVAFMSSEIRREECVARLQRHKASNRSYNKPLRTKQKGIDITHDPLWNKGMAMDYPERDRLGLRGLLPPRVKTLEEQANRIMSHLRNYGDDMVAKNLYLQDLHNRNETLYHRVLADNIEEVAPLVYTPTVGYVCQKFGDQFRRSRGMYFSREDRGLFSSMVWNWPHDDVHVLCVTDGSRILGLGDLGAHGMGIPIGKLALYCAAGGIAPHRVMPVVLDVGTNNEELLNDPSYVGVPKRRLDDPEYYEMLEEFMVAVYDRWPNVVVQFEDFESTRAMPLLAKYAPNASLPPLAVTHAFLSTALAMWRALHTVLGHGACSQSRPWPRSLLSISSLAIWPPPHHPRLGVPS